MSYFPRMFYFHKCLSILLIQICFNKECAKRIWKYERRNKQLIKDFSLPIKQFSRIVWGVEKIQKVNTEILERLKTVE